MIFEGTVATCDNRDQWAISQLGCDLLKHLRDGGTVVHWESGASPENQLRAINDLVRRGIIEHQPLKGYVLKGK
jgi:hypothetical protein